MNHPFTNEPMQESVTYETIKFRGRTVTYEHIAWYGIEGDSFTTTRQDNKNLENLHKGYKREVMKTNNKALNSLLWVLLILGIICFTIFFTK